MSEYEGEASKAPLIEHLTELRRRLIYSITILAVGFVFCYLVSDHIYRILAAPMVAAQSAHEIKHEINNPTNQNVPNVPGVNDTLPDDSPYFQATAPQEVFFTYMKLSLFGAFFLSFPLIANQLWIFVAPGLYREEKHAFLPFLIATPVLFLLGAAFVYFVIMPLALDFFLSFQETGEEDGLSIVVIPKVNEYLRLITSLILAFGVSFQLPVLLLLLARAGLIDADTLRKGRAYAIVAVFAMAAILTPPDIISQIGLAGAVLLLYEGSLFLITRLERKRNRAQKTK